MKRRILSSVVVTALALWPLLAAAQVSSVIQTPVTELLGQQLNYNNYLIHTRKLLGGGNSSGGSTSTPVPDMRYGGVPVATLSPVTHFTPSGPSTVPDALAAQAQTDGQTRAQVAVFYRSLLKLYDDQLVAQHLTRLRNNIAGAYEYATEAAYYVASGGIELNDADSNGLLIQYNRVLTDSPLRKMSNAQKQKTYDSIVIFGGLLLELGKYAARQGDTSMAASNQNNAQQLLISLCGAPAMQLDFTSTGVVRKL
jgi:hypothetical protein